MGQRAWALDWRCRGIIGVAMAMIVGLATTASAARAAPLDGRQYEMVSPSDKNGGDVAGIPTSTRAGSDGGAVSFLSYSGFADVTGAGLSFEYVSTRDELHGWLTHAIQPKQQAEPSDAAGSMQQFYQGEFSEDLSRGVFRAISPLTDAPNIAQARNMNLYLRTDLRSPGSGTYELLTDSTSPLPFTTNTVRPWLAGASTDFRHVLFESQLNLTPDAPPPLPVRPRVYEFHDGSVRLAGILPDGSAAPSSAAGRGAIGQKYTTGTMSRDGARIVFTAPVNASGSVTGGSKVYLRENGVSTVEVSESERTDCAGDPTCGGNGVPEPSPDPAGSQVATYWGATPTASTVHFTSAERLTDDDENDTADLYAYDATRAASEPNNLRRLSVEDPGFGGDVKGVIGASEDGAYVYFVATGQLIDGAPTEGAGLGMDDLYVGHDGELRHIGYIDPLDAVLNLGLAAYNQRPQPARVTPDGRRMVFSSESGTGLTGYDHGVSCGAGALPGCDELYVYAADADNGQGRLTCASCNPSGAAATADASSQATIGKGVVSFTAHRNQTLSEDGRRVFFTTGERLVAEDRNGGIADVYEYEVDTGAIRLISRGTGNAGSYFMDASKSGDDVFFVTRDRLVGSDRDSNYDLYDARVGGGFPELVAPDPPCVGDACRNPLGARPEAAAPGGSMTFVGGGNRPRGRSVSLLRFLPLSARDLSRWARSGRVNIRVRVGDGGRVKVYARARLEGRMQTIASAAKQAVADSPVVLPLRLSDAARRKLAVGKDLRVTLIARRSGQPRAERIKVTLRAADVSTRRGARR